MSAKVDGDYWRHECNRCGKVWYGVKASPKNCANMKCKSPYWNKERVRPNTKIDHIKQKKQIK